MSSGLMSFVGIDSGAGMQHAKGCSLNAFAKLGQVFGVSKYFRPFFIPEALSLGFFGVGVLLFAKKSLKASNRTLFTKVLLYLPHITHKLNI